LIDRLAHKLPFYYGWVILFVAGDSMFVRNAAASLTLAVFIFPISDDLGWSRTLIAGAASLGGLVAAVASPIVGWISDRYGVRVILTVSVLALGISTFSLAWATVPIVFYLAFGMSRVLFSSSLQIGPSVVISRWFVRRRGRATGILFLSHSLGMILFPLLAGLVITYWGWQAAWMVLGVIVWVAALGPVALFIRQSPEAMGLTPDIIQESGENESGSATAQIEEPNWTLREARRTPTLWLLAIATGMLFLMQAGTNTHQGAYFIDQGLGVAISALSISFNAAFTGIGSLAWGWLVERVPVRYCYAAVALVMVVSLFIFPSVTTVWQALLAASLFGVSVGGILVVPAVAYANYFGRRSIGVIRGVTEPFVSLGQAIGAIFSGLVFDISGSYHFAFITLGLVGIATIGLILLTKPPQLRATPTSA
jgi:MFS family permease